MGHSVRITRRPKAETSLEVGRTALLASIVDSSDDAIFGKTLDGTITSWNRAAEIMYGYSAKEIIGQPVSVLVAPDRPKEMDELLAKIRKGERVDHYETVRRRKDGSLVPVSLTVSPIHDTSGELVGASSIARDISERKRIDEQLHLDAERRALLASIVDSSDDAIFAKTLDGTITSWNRAAEMMYGYSAKEIIGQPVSVLFAPDRRNEMGEILAKIRKGERVEHYPTIRRHKDESLVHVSLTVSPIHDMAGRLVGASTIARDMSERERINEQLHLDEGRTALLASIVDSSDDAIFGKTLDGIVTSWNRAAEIMYGYSAREIIGQTVSVLVAPDRPMEMEELLARIRKGGRVDHYETVRRRKDGSLVHVSLTLSPIYDTAGVLVGASSIARDITERKRIDEQLQATSKYARSLIEASVDPLVTISPEGKITDVNEATVRVTGVPRDKLIGTDFSDYFTEPEQAREGYQQVFQQGFVTDYPLTIRHRNGNLVGVLYNASVYKDVNGNVLGVFAAARDVTAQRQAAQYARSLIEASLDPLVTISGEGKITDVNEATVKVTGVPRDKLIGTDFSDYFTEPEQAREGYQQVFQQGFVTDYPLTIRHRDGNLVDVLYNASVYKDVNDNVLGVFAAARDVTAQRQAAQYARSLVEASLDPLVTISPEGKITDVNQATVEVTGVPRDKLIGTDFSDYFTEPEQAREGYQQVFQQGFVTDYPLTIRHRNGNLVSVLYNASVYKDVNGNVLGVFAAARDVTAQRQAGQYARSLIEASLDPLVTISPEGKITDVNEATVKVTGVPRDKLIGTDFSDYFTEPEQAREGYQQVFQQGFVTDYPLTIRHRDGNLVDVLYNASVYKDVNDNVLGVFAAARDVTESKRVTREYAETRNFLDNILESSTKYSIIGKDLNHHILSWNEGARRNYGYDGDEIVGKDSSILHSPEDIASGAVERMLQIAYDKGLAEGEFQRVRKDGSRFFASVVVTRRNDASGNPIGYLLMSNDISEKKRAEEQLREASQYSRSLIEASLDPLVTISPEGKITDVNQATAEVTGIPRDRLIGTDFSDYFTEPEQAREGYQQVFQQGFVTDYPLTIRHEDGRLTNVLYNASVYRDVQGNVLGVFAAARDVTAQRQAAQYARSLIEASLDPLVTISPAGKITDVNEATVKVTGVPRDKLIGTDFSDYFTEPENARKGYEQVFSKGFVTDYALTIRHIEGRLTDVLYNASVYRDVQGNVLGVFAAARDVTAQKEVEVKIAEQRAREEERARELDRLAELERFQKLTVGRELKMIELKKEIEELRKEVDTVRSKAQG